MDAFEGPISEGFDIFILFQILAVYSKEMRDELLESRFTIGQKKAYEFFKCHCGRIEINVDNNLERTYFPIKPVCHYLNQKMKDKFKFGADRTSPNLKIRSLIDSSKFMIMEMNHHAKVDNNKCMISPRIVAGIRDISTFLAVVMNILMLAYLKLNPGKTFKSL